MTEPSAFWESCYQEKSTPWDLGGPTPVFERLIAQGRIPRGKLLVPGAGRGYDAIAFASAGFQVTTVDVSATACEELRRAAAEAGVDVDVRQADFFRLQDPGAFDAALEYTFYCAIDPSLREAYRDRMAHLIKPGGLLFGLYFPLRAPSEEGPPFAVDPAAIEATFSQSFELLSSERPEESIKPRKGNEVLMFWRRKESR